MGNNVNKKKKTTNVSEKNKSEKISGLTAQEKKMILTPNEEDFVFYLLEGDSRRRAYKKAYPNCNADDRVVDVKAYKVFNRDRVRIRYETGLEEIRRQRLQEAIVRGKKADEELEKIAYGLEKYPAYDFTGNEYERFPSIGQRLKAMEILKKDSTEIIKTQAAKEENLNEGSVDINIKVVD